jgi:hypothetical protein
LIPLKDITATSKLIPKKLLEHIELKLLELFLTKIAE